MPSDESYLGVEHRSYLNGMRHDGQRWVDATRPDRPMLPIIRHEQPGKDIFGGSGMRKPPRAVPKKKSRRRGGF